MKKKLLALLLTALMLLGLTACGGSGDDSGADTGAPDTGAADGAATPAEDGADDAQASDESDAAYVTGKGTLVVGITDFEPMDYKNDAGEWIGFDADMAKVAVERAGEQVKLNLAEYLEKGIVK